jgi:hypothetical protein
MVRSLVGARLTMRNRGTEAPTNATLPMNQSAVGAQSHTAAAIAAALRARGIRIGPASPLLLTAIAAGVRLPDIADVIEQNPRRTVAWVLDRAAQIKRGTAT